MAKKDVNTKAEETKEAKEEETLTEEAAEKESPKRKATKEEKKMKKPNKEEPTEEIEEEEPPLTDDATDFLLDDTDDLDAELIVDEQILEEIANEQSDEFDEDEINEYDEINEENEVDINPNTSDKGERKRAKPSKERILYGKTAYDDSMNDDEKRALMRRVIASKILLNAELITVREKNITTSEGELLTIVCGIFKLEKPFESFTVQVPFSEMFTAKELLLLKDKKSYLKNKSIKRREYSYINTFLAGRTTLQITRLSKKSLVCEASRVEALKRQEKIYFERGILGKNGERTRPKKGSIIRGCNVFLVENGYIRVDVCGIPTRINKVDLSYKLEFSAKDIINPGDKIDVLILDIIEFSNQRKLKVSSKELYDNPTKKPFEEACKNLGPTGRVVGTIIYIDKDPKKTRYGVFTETGYRAIALSHKVSFNPNNYMNDIDAKKLKPGTKVIFEPYLALKKSFTMVGQIVEVKSR